MSVRIAPPQSEADWRQARQLVEAYGASLDLDLSFQNFAHEVAHLAVEYASPAGAFLLAREAGAYLGCVGVRRFADGIGEVKRLYVSPAARSRGVGRLLAAGIIARCGQIGYSRLLLDTLPSMTAAQSLYASLGFQPTAPYRFNPVAGAVFLELALR